MRLCAAAALLTAAGLSIGAASAAELGTLSVSSRLNEPLAAKLTVNDVSEASQPLVLRLASDAVYAREPQSLGGEHHERKTGDGRRYADHRRNVGSREALGEVLSREA